MTNDFNLSKVAQVRGVEVVNLNDLVQALRPVVLPGEAMRVRIAKPGEGATQGVGYLEDGTMVVVENARQMIGQEVELTVTSMLQTSAGRMIFGKAPPPPASGLPPAPGAPVSPAGAGQVATGAGVGAGRKNRAFPPGTARGVSHLYAHLGGAALLSR